MLVGNNNSAHVESTAVCWLPKSLHAINEQTTEWKPKKTSNLRARTLAHLQTKDHFSTCICIVWSSENAQRFIRMNEWNERQPFFFAQLNSILFCIVEKEKRSEKKIYYNTRFWRENSMQCVVIIWYSCIRLRWRSLRIGDWWFCGRYDNSFIFTLSLVHETASIGRELTHKLTDKYDTRYTAHSHSKLDIFYRFFDFNFFANLSNRRATPWTLRNSNEIKMKQKILSYLYSRQ